LGVLLPRGGLGLAGPKVAEISVPDSSAEPTVIAEAMSVGLPRGMFFVSTTPSLRAIYFFLFLGLSLGLAFLFSFGGTGGLLPGLSRFAAGRTIFAM
jgi:hypothetical protein